jgi:membrane-associated phospholipid phosphatase
MAATAVLVYAAMWIGWVQGWAWLTAVDNWGLNAVYPAGAASPVWVTSWNVFCSVLGPGAFRLVGIGVIIWLLIHRNMRGALFLVISVELSGLVTASAKLLANRSRPPTAMVYAQGSSFPSGHALGVLVGVLALLTVTWTVLPPRWRSVLVVIGAVVILAIGLGRVALNVHHPSDVVAGWALGYLWYLACLWVVRHLPLARVTATSGTPADLDSGQ